MNVMIGIDPHKASHTAVAIGRDEDQISTVKVRATVRQVDQLLSWAEPFGKRTWAIESVGGLGYLLAQQLVARGEDVLDVPATLASRIRVLATKRSNKNDPNDAHSIAIAALRAPTPSLGRSGRSWRGPAPARRSVTTTWAASELERSAVCTHSLPRSLPGGIAKEMYVSDADTLLATLNPESQVQQTRFDLILDLLDDVRRLDAQIKESHRRIAIGGSGLGHLGHRALRDRPDPCCDADRPLRRRPTFRQPRCLCLLQRHGSDRAVLGWADRAPALAPRQPQAQPRPPHGRRHPDPQSRHPRDGSTSTARLPRARRRRRPCASLKRQISNAVYRQLLLDAASKRSGRTLGNDS